MAGQHQCNIYPQAAFMTIRPSSMFSESKFRDFWAAALAYQKREGLQIWPAYPEKALREEIEARRHFSAFTPEGVLAGYFSLALSDVEIWSEKEKGDAIYIHRMCVNPECKGSRLAAWALAWAHGYAAGCGRKYVRMDTWGDNPRLIGYYVACGFRQAGNRQMGGVRDLSPHYQNAYLALFENEV
jgi:ribosomal protein S18 acetylase RimI-like enzyme